MNPLSRLIPMMVGWSLSTAAGAADLTAPEAFIHTIAWLEASQKAGVSGYVLCVTPMITSGAKEA